MRWNCLSLEGTPLPEPSIKPTYVCDVEVDVVTEVDANVGVIVYQGTVDGSPTDADHHSKQTQQQEDQAGISKYLI